MRPHYCQKVPTRLNSLDPPVWHRWSFFHSLTRLGPVRKLIRGWPQVWETARSVSLAPATGGLFYNWCDASRNPDCVVCDKRWWETMIEKERECERKNEQLRVCACVRVCERARERERNSGAMKWGFCGDTIILSLLLEFLFHTDWSDNLKKETHAMGRRQHIFFFFFLSNFEFIEWVAIIPFKYYPGPKFLHFTECITFTSLWKNNYSVILRMSTELFNWPWPISFRCK